MRTLYFCPVASSSSFFFFPRLISAVTKWMSTILLLMVSPYCELRCRSEMCCTLLVRIQDAKSRQKSTSGHHRTTSSGFIFATKARIDNRKKVLSSNMSPQYGELRPTSGWDQFTQFVAPQLISMAFASWQRYCMHGSQVVSVSQTLRRSTEGATYVRQGDHHVGHWPTF